MNQIDHYVGIRNSSGVSCHLSSAIQLLRHAMDVEERQNLISVSKLLVSHKCVLNNDDSKDSSCSLRGAKQFLIHLGQLLGKMTLMPPQLPFQKEGENYEPLIKNERECINPSDIYQCLHPRIDASIPGDAATSLRFLMKMLKESIDCISDALQEKRMKYEDDLSTLLKSLQSIFLNTFWGGIMNHQLSGYKVITKTDDSSLVRREKIIRKKPIKERPLPYIITLPIQRNDTNRFLDALNSIISKPQPIHGYSWDDMDENDYEQEVIVWEEKSSNDCDENKLQNDDGLLAENLIKLNITDNDQHAVEEGDDNDQSDESSSDSSSSSYTSSSSSSSSSSYTSSSSSTNPEVWNSEKRIWLSSVPKCLIFHLKRFEYRGGKVQNVSSKVDIPMEFFLCQSVAQLDCCNHEEGSCFKYVLTGAIVYSDDKSNKTTTLSDIGHYLCYFKKRSRENQKGQTNSSEEWVKIDDDKVLPIQVNETSMTNDNNFKIISKEKLLNMFGGISSKTGYWSAFILLYHIS